jgi:hypothetical protein
MMYFTSPPPPLLLLLIWGWAGSTQTVLTDVILPQPPGRKMSAEIVKRVSSYNSVVGSAEASPAASPLNSSRRDKPPSSPAATTPPAGKEGADREAIAKGTVGERVKAYQAHTAGAAQSEGQPLLTSRPEMESGGCCTCVLS